MTSPSIAQGAGRQFDYWWTVYLRTWKATIFSSFVSPLFYVVAMGVLLGGFVHADPAKLEGATSYLAFLVPGLVAAQAMQTAIGEVTYPVMGAIKWHKTYYAQIATPLTPRDLVTAQLGFVLFRVASTCGVFMLVLAPFGVFANWWGPLLAFPVQVLTGLAFAAPVFAFSAHTKSEAAFGLVYRLGVLPLMLFSGAFFPVSNLGHAGAWAARLTPLWHGVNLSRMLCLDHVDWTTAVVNVVVLLAVAVVGWVLAVRELTKRLVD